jgi:hypothetical protein
LRRIQDAQDRTFSRWGDLAHQAAAGPARRKDLRNRHACRAADNHALYGARPPQRVRARSAGAWNAGRLVESRDDPEAAFAGQTLETPWDKFHVAYFASEALWTYLTSPFLYTYPGFESEEIEPWHENGEEWRRLKVTFPDRIASHTKTQITHFGPDGLMRRHDYTVDILGGNSGTNYVSGYRDFQGIKMPSTRRIYAYDENMQKVPEPVLVSLDFGEMTFNWASAHCPYRTRNAPPDL